MMRRRWKSVAAAAARQVQSRRVAERETKAKATVAATAAVEAWTQRRRRGAAEEAPPTAAAAAAAGETPFVLEDGFLAGFQPALRRPPFGFNGLGELVYARTYARPVADAAGGRREAWHENVARVVQGTFRMQQDWVARVGLPWDDVRAQDEAQTMYELIFAMKFLPPGRGLWAMGSPLTEERRLYAALNNCAFVSTAEIAADPEQPAEPFAFLMDASMLGVGVGFDTLGAGTVQVFAPTQWVGPPHVIADSREGWVESVRMHINAYLAVNRDDVRAALPVFDYSAIRPPGAPIRGFGGISQGPDILRDLHNAIDSVLAPLVGSPLSVRAIVDIMNLIGKCVVAGNVRRTAEIAFGDPSDEEYISLKDYDAHPERQEYGWTSNNSVLATCGMDYTEVCKHVRRNGEPGFAWLENMRAYGRMGDPPNNKDARAMGGNPCLEQTLESFELCCLVETFPFKHSTLQEYEETLRSAMLYAKTVTLGPTHWPKTNTVMMRNRRIGCSMSGAAQFIAARGLGPMRAWCDAGYQAIQTLDEEFSERFAVPRSIKTTSIKPSGTVSLLAGATPGIHFPESRFYIRRVRLSKSSDLVPQLEAANYDVEDCVNDPENSVVASIPIDVGEGVRTLNDVTVWEQLAMAAFFQRHWADNQVSCTVTFDPETEGEQLAHALDHYQYQLKGISFLPRIISGAYPQMPYEAIDEATYETMAKSLKPLHIASQAHLGGGGANGTTIDVNTHVPDKFCDSTGCSLDFKEAKTREQQPL